MPVQTTTQQEVIVIKKQEEVDQTEEESSSEEEEVQYVKTSVEGVCDFDFCNEQTFMRCDYDMNDIIDPRSSRCQLILTCRWKGIRGCERQFCHFHAGKLSYWPSRCCSSSSSVAILPCDDCYYWIRYVKCKFWGTICLFFLWMALCGLIVYFSLESFKGSYDYENRINRF